MHDFRHFGRHSAHALIFAYVRNKESHVLGQLFDVSQGGCSFVYVQDINHSFQFTRRSLFEMDLLSIGNGVSIEKLPVKFVYKIPITQTKCSQVITSMKCGVIFEFINEAQKRQIDVFVKKVVESNV